MTRSCTQDTTPKRTDSVRGYMTTLETAQPPSGTCNQPSGGSDNGVRPKWRGSIMMTTNLPFDEWTELFDSERLT